MGTWIDQPINQNKNKKGKLHTVLKKKKNFQCSMKLKLLEMFAYFGHIFWSPSCSSFRSFSVSSWRTDFWVLRTATYISKSVRHDFSASRTWLSSFTWNLTKHVQTLFSMIKSRSTHKQKTGKLIYNLSTLQLRWLMDHWLSIKFYKTQMIYDSFLRPKHYRSHNHN